MKFLTSDVGHLLIEQAEFKVRVTDGALFIGNDKDLGQEYVCVSGTAIEFEHDDYR